MTAVVAWKKKVNAIRSLGGYLKKFIASNHSAIIFANAGGFEQLSDVPRAKMGSINKESHRRAASMRSMLAMFCDSNFSVIAISRDSSCCDNFKNRSDAIGGRPSWQEQKRDLLSPKIIEKPESFSLDYNGRRQHARLNLK